MHIASKQDTKKKINQTVLGATWIENGGQRVRKLQYEKNEAVIAKNLGFFGRVLPSALIL